MFEERLSKAVFGEKHPKWGGGAVSPYVRINVLIRVFGVWRGPGRDFSGEILLVEGFRRAL